MGFFKCLGALVFMLLGIVAVVLFLGLLLSGHVSHV